MTKEIAEKIVKGITDKIEANTADIDDWAEFWGFTREEYEEFLDIKGIIEYIDELPVTPQTKMGRWINDKCSVCGKGIEDLISSSEWYRNEEPNFCPFCGIKLVNSQKSEKINCKSTKCENCINHNYCDFEP